MLATNGPRWYDHRPESNWSSFGVSIAVTIGIFLAAISSMRTVSSWLEPRSIDRETPTMVELQPPVAEPKPIPKPVVRPEPVAPSVAAPTTVPMTIDMAPPIVPPASVPTTIGPGSTSTDTNRVKSSGPAIPLGPVGGKGGEAPISGAPIAAGVTSGEALPGSARSRDSIIAVGVMGDARLWLTDKYKPKGAELAELQYGKRVADRMMRRTTSAGAWQDVNVLTGDGKDGVGAIGGGKNGVHMTPNGAVVSVPFPLLSSGPSPAERKRNEKLVAEYRGYLHRMDDRIVLRADSIRADSLRRDSIAKARARIVP